MLWGKGLVPVSACHLLAAGCQCVLRPEARGSSFWPLLALLASTVSVETRICTGYGNESFSSPPCHHVPIANLTHVLSPSSDGGRCVAREGDNEQRKLITPNRLLSVSARLSGDPLLSEETVNAARERPWLRVDCVQGIGLVFNEILPRDRGGE